MNLMENNQIITRADAIRLKRKRYFTGKPCKHGHTAERFTSTGNCASCHKDRGHSFVSSRQFFAARSAAAGLQLFSFECHPDDMPALQAIAEGMAADRLAAYDRAAAVPTMPGVLAAIVENAPAHRRIDGTIVMPDDLPRPVLVTDGPATLPWLK